MQSQYAKIGDADGSFHERARRIGYLSSSCDTCGAGGRAERLAGPFLADPVPEDFACVDCGGSGRWWFPMFRGLGSRVKHLTDAQLGALLEAGDPVTAHRAS